ncbi:MAG: GTPase HflX, partial [Alphaproteobacteria bacterium]|nr:GTPase HflX [Alphaproteobacteria bacterium]
RATLEEVQEASVILHVRDISQENTEAEKEDVLNILNDLGIGSENDDRIIEVLNKIDILPEKDRSAVITRSKRQGKAVAISALTGDGIDHLLEVIDARLGQNQQIVYVDIPLTDGKALSWLYSRCHVVNRMDDEDFVHIKVGMEPEDMERFCAQFPYRFNKNKMKKKKMKTL